MLEYVLQCPNIFLFPAWSWSCTPPCAYASFVLATSQLISFTCSLLGGHFMCLPFYTFCLHLLFILHFSLSLSFETFSKRYKLCSSFVLPLGIPFCVVLFFLSLLHAPLKFYIFLWGEWSPGNTPSDSLVLFLAYCLGCSWQCSAQHVVLEMKPRAPASKAMLNPFSSSPGPQALCFFFVYLNLDCILDRIFKLIVYYYMENGKVTILWRRVFWTSLLSLVEIKLVFFFSFEYILKLSLNTT